MRSRALGHFYVTVYVTDRKSALRATEAILHRMPITISGKVGEEVETVTGVVRSVDEDTNASPRRWRITILDENRLHSQPVVSFLRP